ncbi:MAG TPA: universal stress protein [Solirubrobacteraceae bacterium]|nr:universal stress protein [Solirubrobacteraceae bacterium]
MFDKVVVGVDGRAGGRDAIALALQLARGPGRLVLANIYGTATAGIPAQRTPASHAQAHHLVTAARLEHELNCATSVRRDAEPGRGLHRLAEHQHADLLVVGSSHRAGLGRILLGDDTLAALHGAPCAVAIAPRGYVFANPRWETIGVGDDGSPESALAMETARELARVHRAQIRTLSVVPLQSPEDCEAPPDWTDATADRVRIEQSRLDAIGDIAGEAVYGDPATELARLARSVDLLIVGSRGQGPVGRFVNGSVSTHLSRRAACPLLVLPRRLSAAESPASDAPSQDLRVPAGSAS